jgi:KUP system potassium uptake protein
MPVVLLKVTTEHSPRVGEENRVKAMSLPSGFRLLWLVFGFAETPDVPAALRLHPEALECDPDEASFFLGRETPVPSLRPHLSALAAAALCIHDAQRGLSPRLLPDTFGSRR